MAEFKWNNRKKATETAIQLKKEGMTAEEAVKKVMEEYEGVYFTNGKEISEKRFNNFIERVSKEKEYKASKSSTLEKELKHSKLKEAFERGEITALQATFLDGVYKSLVNYAPGESDVSLKDVAISTGLKVESLKTTLAGLVKKKFLRVEPVKIGEEQVDCIFIEESKYNLFNDDAATYHEEYAKMFPEEEASEEPKGELEPAEEAEKEAVGGVNE